MELLTYKDKDTEYTYYLDKRGNWVLHGEYKDYRPTGQLWGHCFYYHDVWHGEYRAWDIDGKEREHCFYINGVSRPYVEMNEHEKLLFQIQHPGFRFIEN